MRIFNSLKREYEDFVPLSKDGVSIYACGPTVYDHIHIGNARPLIVFDTLRRYLEYCGYSVRFVQNFTDIDDKMIRRAREENTTVKKLADRFIAEYFRDAGALNVRPATVHPRATENMDDIIRLVRKLVDGGHAYAADGDVYFDTASFPEYGVLSGQDLRDLEIGARVEADDRKRTPLDFALWKARKEGEPYWESPWGDGRPGWHIECSAMSMKHLGETLDIHCGGQDLKFPHHENEIAQSEAATGKPFARYWMHNGYINVDGRKMSKSEGGFVTVRDILRKYDGLAVRLFMLSAHYANPVSFSEEPMDQARKALERLNNCREHLAVRADHPARTRADVREAAARLDVRFREAMDDDLNTAKALGAVFDYVTEVNTLFRDAGGTDEAELALRALDERLDVLGLVREDDPGMEISDEVKRLSDERTKARQEKDWTRADRLRDEIAGLGFDVKDTPDGTVLSRRREGRL